MSSPVPARGKPVFLFGQNQPAQVAAPPITVWTARDEFRQEFGQLETYRTCGEFWDACDGNFAGTWDGIWRARTEMEMNTRWRGAAATEFYLRVDAGIGSIERWLGGRPGQVPVTRTGLVRDLFRELVGLLERENGVVEQNSATLLRQDKIVDTRMVTVPRTGVQVDVTAKITERDTGEVRVPDGDEGEAQGAVNAILARHTQLQRLIERLTLELGQLPHDQGWLGPSAFAELPPPGGPAAATTPGGPAPGGAGGPGSTRAPDAAGPGGPGGAPPGPDAAASPSTPEPGAEQPGVDQPVLDEPAGPTGDPPAVDPAVDPAVADLPPPTGPELAGMPTMTPTPTSSLPGSGIGPLPGSVPSGLSATPVGGPGSTGSPIPLTPVGGAPLPSQFSSPVRRDAEPPPTRSSTVDGTRSGVPGAQGESPVPPGGSGSSSGSRTGFGPGFYPPPMIPPMGMGAGAGNGEVRPGEADFANGPVRQVRGPETWRAGLRPQLLGRAGDRDDEQDDYSPPAPGDEVLDEELWQVPGVAPPTPPEPRSRRGHSWGP